jgi:hypothetical protein
MAVPAGSEQCWADSGSTVGVGFSSRARTGGVASGTVCLVNHSSTRHPQRRLILSNIRRVTLTGPEKRGTFINLNTVWHLQRSGKGEYTTVKFSDQHSLDIIETPEAVFKLAEKG